MNNKLNMATGESDKSAETKGLVLFFSTDGKLISVKDLNSAPFWSDACILIPNENLDQDYSSVSSKTDENTDQDP